uniref:NADH dehydrogenase subunit 4 n=1 Tax=Tetraonchus monenteron TaxID=198446 RepID=UPI00143689BC|nr:NADH dehydrogenase subunit 4 [Tetraonchus monenteron]QIH29911.1 NADH dehydrogenase subunit 4 [Tetraonchus monenteron]
MWGLLGFLVVLLFFCYFFNLYFIPASYFLFIFSGDSYSLYLILILFFFFLAFYFDFTWNISASYSILLFVSLLFCFFCFFTNHLLFFWFSYELTILPLLLMLFTSSPYSERFLAGWYLLCYSLFTSLPLLFCIVYCGYYYNSYSFFSVDNFFLCLCFFILFIVKIPLPPFHTWLPIVHAEASSSVSIFLSGFVMKLGLIGIYRFSLFLFNNFTSYIVFCFFCCTYFFISASVELDAKRWLALLSLSHIVICLIGLLCCHFDSFGVISLFCLGHGFSAASFFYLINNFYNSNGSRNWLIWIENNSNSYLVTLLFLFNVLTLVSFPVSLQFLSEVNVLFFSSASLVISILFFFYLFVGGVLPLFLVSLFMSRNTKIGGCYSCFNLNGIFILFYLPLLCLLSCYFL